MAIGTFTVRDLKDILKKTNLSSDLTLGIVIYMEDDDICTDICSAEIIEQNNNYYLKLIPDTDYKKERTKDYV